MALDLSAASYESGRRALQLAVGSGGSIQEIGSLLAQEAEDHRNSSSRDPTHYSGRPIRCDHHTALEVAASAGHMDAVERLLAAGADPNDPVHEMGISVLTAAAGQGQLIVVQKLLDKGADPNHCGERSDATPLIAAAKAGHIEICKALLQSGADVSIWRVNWAGVSMNGTRSAIQAAGESSSITLLELFLDAVEDTAKDFDPDDLKAAVAEGRQKDSARLLRTETFLKRARTSINQALGAAARAGNMLILQRLLDAGADVTGAEDSYGINAIAAAASGGHLEVVNRLLQTVSILPADALTVALQFAVDTLNIDLIGALLRHGADATKIDIRRAAAEGHLDVLTFILQSGALVDTKSKSFDFDNFSALQLAVYHGHQAVVDLLLAEGADVNQQVNHGSMKGTTALQLAVAGKHLAMTKRLIDAGADVNAPCDGADTALEAAVRTGDTAMLELLLAAGAVVDVEGVSWPALGKTALSIAAEVNNSNLVARLLSIMPPGDARRAALLALQKAAENRNADIVRQLLQVHPDVNHDDLQLSLLQTAAANGDLEILQMLLSEGADVNFSASGGRQTTALQAASEQGDPAVVKLLLAAGAEVNVTGSTAPPLLLAVRGGHVQVFEDLLAAGADIHATAYRGQTMLEAAEDSGDAEIQDRVRAVLDSRPPPQGARSSVSSGRD